jgi:hypothetical protein
MRLILPLLLLSLAVGCDDPEPSTPPGDDDDVVADDDDSAPSVDDDDAVEEPTPEEVVVPDGADVGVPGSFVGLRVRTLGNDPIISPPVEVGLGDPNARSIHSLDPTTQAEMDAVQEALSERDKAAVRAFGDHVTDRLQEVER